MSTKTFVATTRAWSVEFLLPDHDVRCLAADPLNPSRLYAGTQAGGVLRSNDAGQTWQAAGLAGQTVKALAISPTQPGMLYAGTKPAHLFVSHDGGASWKECGIRPIMAIPGNKCQFVWGDLTTRCFYCHT